MIKALIGAGGFANEISIYDDIIYKFVDDIYYNNEDFIHKLSEFNVDIFQVVIAIGDSRKRYEQYLKLPKGCTYFNIISNSAHILNKDTVTIGKGSVICAGSILTTNITIGNHAHINLNTTIGHDCVIGDFFTTAPGVNISGKCKIGDRVYIGSNATIREKITICDDVIIGLNSGVVKDITEPGVYVGTPAIKIK